MIHTWCQLTNGENVRMEKSNSLVFWCAMKTLLWPQILNRIHQWVNVDTAGSVCSASTDQQGSFVSVDSSEPQLHVGAAAVFRVRPDDDVPISSVTLEQTEMILKAGHLTNNHKQNNTVIVPGLHSCWPLLGVKGPPALTCILALVLCCISSIFTNYCEEGNNGLFIAPRLF